MSWQVRLTNAGIAGRRDKKDSRVSNSCLLAGDRHDRMLKPSIEDNRKLHPPLDLAPPEDPGSQLHQTFFIEEEARLVSSSAPSGKNARQNDEGRLIARQAHW